MENSLDSILSNTVETPAAEVTAPEVPEQTTAQEPTTGEEVAASPAAEPKDDPLEKHRKGLEAAATAERKRRQDAEARSQQLERELHALRNPPPPPQRQEVSDKPLREQYASEDDWLDARDEWRDKQTAQEAAEAKAQEQAKTLYEKTESIYAKAQALEGFDRMAFDRLPLTQPIVEALVDSDNAPALMVFMASHPEDVARIAGLPKTRQIAELTRIEDKLSATPPTPPVEKEKPQLPETLTQARNAKGQFEPAYSGPTPLNAILNSK